MAFLANKLPGDKCIWLMLPKNQYGKPAGPIAFPSEGTTAYSAWQNSKAREPFGAFNYYPTNNGHVAGLDTCLINTDIGLVDFRNGELHFPL